MRTYRLFLIAFALLLSGAAKAIPAYPGLMSRQQPDGTTLTVQLHGDEYVNFTTTADGYTVVHNADGFLCYALRTADGQLASTGRVAHDAEQRTDAERQWLQGVDKYMSPAMDAATAASRHAEQTRQARARAAAQAHAPLFDYSNFRGLIILVEFNDRKFSRDDYPDIIRDMVNQADYKGYGKLGNGVFTGSVRDYFYDNSMGVFAPQFDIAGPVTVNVSQNYPKKTDNAYDLMKRVADAADAEVDFSQYDLDHDGVVDMVYIIFAGYGAQYEGDNSKLIWPHASEFYNPSNWSHIYKDKVRLGRYACSTELLGTQSSGGFFDGIGTMCHEFSHVLGLPDLYDTDYELSGGESIHPGDWTIMAGGGYQNYGRTPSGYTLYERYSLGFATPAVISEEGHYELEAVATSNFGYRLNSTVKKEFFLIENRQKTSKWEQYLPGHGMIVFRVDSTNSSVWRDNTVNCNPNHNYFVLLRAGGSTASGHSSDPFPGPKKVHTLNNYTEPANLLAWSGQPTLLGFENITEKSEVISFDIVDVNVLRSISLPEELTLGLGLSVTLEPERTPDYAPYTLKWYTDNPAVATVDARGLVTARALGTAVITVIANDKAELSARCTITVTEPDIVPDIASYRQLDDSTEALLRLDDALVVFSAEDMTFVRDASSAICLNVDGLGLEAGDMLNGQIYGRKAVIDGMPMLLPAAYGTNSESFKVTKGHEVTPRRLAVSELTDADRCDLVTLTAATLKRDNGVWIEDDSHRIRVYNLFQVQGLESIPKTLKGKFFDVTGIYYVNKDGSKIIDEIERTANVVEVADPSGIATVSLEGIDGATPAAVYTTDGRLVARTTAGRLATLPLRHGLYIVKTAAGTRRLSR